MLPSAEVIVAVDNSENVAALDEAAQGKGVQLKVVIEVNTGMDRAGVEPGAPVVDLASTISKCQGLHFRRLDGMGSPHDPNRKPHRKEPSGR